MKDSEVYFHDKQYTDMWGINPNEEMHFYYDESNNCRRFLLSEGKMDFNTDIAADFVLAGVCCDKALNIEFTEIAERFSLQKNALELKSKSFWSGKDFFQCVGTKQTTALIRLIDDYDLFIHYQHVNNFFYTVVEILDSITTPEEIYDFGFDYFALKATFYKMLKRNISEVTKVFLKYSYPNVKDVDINGFCLELLATLENRKELRPDEKYIAGVLRRSAGNKELIFIQNNTDYIMQDNFAEFYANNILENKKSFHHYDEELSIQDIVKEHVSHFDENICNYEFLNSKSNTLLQVSDVVAGLFGRLFTYVNNHEQRDFWNDIPKLTDNQLRNMCDIQRLRAKSDRRNKGFLHSLTAVAEIEKLNALFDMAKAEIRKRGSD